MTRISQNLKIFPKIVGSFRLTHLPSFEPPLFGDNNNSGSGPWWSGGGHVIPPAPPAQDLLFDGSTTPLQADKTGTHLQSD